MGSVRYEGNTLFITYTPINEEDKNACMLIPKNKYLLSYFVFQYIFSNNSFLNGSFEGNAEFKDDVLYVEYRKIS